MTTNLGLIDLLVLVISIGGIAVYGMWATRARESSAFISAELFFLKPTFCIS
jgi:FtsZ-interacting cell division protein ZipA